MAIDKDRALYQAIRLVEELREEDPEDEDLVLALQQLHKKARQRWEDQPKLEENSEDDATHR